MTISSRREREQKLRRETIIEAARQLFEQKGYELTTVDEIAATAELGKGTIYSYFKSKEEIYVAILEKRMETLKERMEQAVANPSSAIQALYSLYDTFIQYQLERKGFIETLFVQADEQIFTRLEGLVGGLKNKASIWVDLVGKVLQWGIDRGEFIKFNVDKMARIIVGMILGIVVQYEIGRIDEDITGYRDSVFKLILNGIKS